MRKRIIYNTNEAFCTGGSYCLHTINLYIPIKNLYKFSIHRGQSSLSLYSQKGIATGRKRPQIKFRS